jgi:hypothetical protein
MKKLTGTDFAKAIEQLTALQTSQAQEAYSLLIARLLGAFTIKYEIPVQSGAVSAISRILKRLDDDGIRQIRAMSDTLLKVDDQALREELLELQVQLLPMSAQTHQVKTRSAFISTVLRPFDFKYSKRWLSERKDIDIDSARRRIEDLERRELSTTDAILRWADEVLALFNDLVIFWGEEADQYYLRPAGTISPKSSRTYAQAWTTFINNFADQALDMALSDSSLQNADQTLYSMGVPDNFEVGLSQSVPDDLESLKLNYLVSDSRQNFESITAKKSREQKVSAPRSRSAWIKVLLESRLDSTAQATRKWDNQTAFHESLNGWLNSVEEIWGPAAKEMSAKVSVKTSDGEAELTIPNVNTSDALKRIIKTAELLQGN